MHELYVSVLGKPVERTEQIVHMLNEHGKRYIIIPLLHISLTKIPKGLYFSL